MEPLDLVAPWKDERPRHRLWQVKRAPTAKGRVASWEPANLRPAAPPLRPVADALLDPLAQRRGAALNGSAADMCHKQLQSLIEAERSFDLAKERGRLARERQQQRRQAEAAADADARRLRAYAEDFGRSAAAGAIEQLRQERQEARSALPHQATAALPRSGSPAWLPSRGASPPAARCRSPSTPARADGGAAESASSPSPAPRPSGPHARWHSLHRSETANGRARVESLRQSPHSHADQHAAPPSARTRAPLRARMSPLRAPPPPPPAPADGLTLAARLESMQAAKTLAAKVIQRLARRISIKRQLRRRDESARVLQEGARQLLMRRARERALQPTPLRAKSLRGGRSPRGRWAEQVRVRGAHRCGLSFRAQPRGPRRGRHPSRPIPPSVHTARAPAS